MDISIAIESCNELWLTSCAKDSDNLFMVECFAFYCIMKNVCFENGSVFINLIAFISVGTHYCHKKLQSQFFCLKG